MNEFNVILYITKILYRQFRDLKDEFTMKVAKTAHTYKRLIYFFIIKSSCVWYTIQVALPTHSAGQFTGCIFSEPQ